MGKLLTRLQRVFKAITVFTNTRTQ